MFRKWNISLTVSWVKVIRGLSVGNIQAEKCSSNESQLERDISLEMLSIYNLNTKVILYSQLHYRPTSAVILSTEAYRVILYFQQKLLRNEWNAISFLYKLEIKETIVH
jgi:hypothetical protein